LEGYIIVKKNEPYQETNRFGYNRELRDGAMYILVKETKPIGYCYTVEKNLNEPELKGKGLLTKNILIDDSERGNQLALKFYYWLLTHVCDYVIPDESHTRAGAALWRKLNQSKKFDLFVFDPKTYTTRKRWAGKDWNQIYQNDRLQPILTIAGRNIKELE
jgi:hypothetical protein